MVLKLWSELLLCRVAFVTDSLVKIHREDGTIVCPYIKTRRSYIFIGDGDYIVTDIDGARHVCGEDKVWLRYEKI